MPESGSRCNRKPPFARAEAVIHSFSAARVCGTIGGVMKQVRRIAFAAALAALGGFGGCWGGGYVHTHPHLCPDGRARTHRHWHADTGKAGHHEHPHLNQQHKELAWQD